MKFRSIHSVDAVFDHDHGEVAAQAAVAVAITQELVFTPVIRTVLMPCERSRKIEIGAEEAVVPFLRVDNEITRDRSSGGITVAAGHADDVVTQHVLARGGRVLGAMRQDGLARISSASR